MLGPLYVEFDEAAVEKYLDGHPSHTERGCLQDFFEDLQRIGSSAPFTNSGGYFVVDVCGYIVHLRDIADDGTRVRVEGIGRSLVGASATR